ncbi:MAG: PDDEXK nuclease domain-containing protein, partial [Clostridiales Family XIII bacterium]|nr:PDDEXK nuclease domain-containing protein [Clostridiales Family XIII bacterium]
MTDIVKCREAVLAIKNAILQSRYQAAKAANREQLMLYYNIGRYVSENTRSGKWGTGAVEEISRQLQSELPGLRGFSPTNMKYMRLFYDNWKGNANRQLPTDDLEKMDTTAIRQLVTDELKTDDMEAFLSIGFTHHTEIISKCKTAEEHWYYIKRCAYEFWSVEALKSHIRADEFHRYGAVINNFVSTMPDTKLSAKAVRSFKDEYLLDFINIEDDDDPETSDERVLSKALIADIQKFITSFGEGFCFVGREQRVIVGEQEFFIDLLFFSRNLNCLVAVELKRSSFKAAYLGQLNFYLSALDKHMKKPHENKSIGLLLCKDINKAVAELAVQDFNKPMGIAI